MFKVILEINKIFFVASVLLILNFIVGFIVGLTGDKLYLIKIVLVFLNVSGAIIIVSKLFKQFVKKDK